MRARTAAILGLLLVARAAHADEPREEQTPEHTEYAGFPLVAGSTDIGVQAGAAGSATRTGGPWRSLPGGIPPYRWKLDLLGAASAKGGPNGLEIVQQNYDVGLDVPRALGGKAFVMPEIIYERTINSGYFGLGNQSVVVHDENGQVGRRYQFEQQELRARVNVRSPLGGPFAVMVGLQLRYVHPTAYANSKLAIDAASREPDGSPVIRGLEPLDIGVLNGGLIYDTRDNAIAPNRGAFDLVALRFAEATPTSSDVRWAGANVVVRRYARLGGPFVLATRVIGDFMVGNVPFYDLSQGGAFVPTDLPGGAQGIRGVPYGRYSGLIKLVGNVEVRSFFASFHLFGDRFRVGDVVFFDTGRIWTDYTFSDARDGKQIGLKFGAGGGLFLLWGTAAMFRVEVAYSPDASAANPGFPVGIYVADGLMF